MSWHFSQALVAEYSQDTCSGGEQSVLSNTNPMPLLFSSSAKMMEFCSRSRSGMTCEPLMDSLGEDVLTWFLEGFLAPTSAPQDVAPESQAKHPDSGRKWRASFAKFDRVSCSWKIPHCLPLVGSMSFSATWPRWGSMRNGACMAQPMPELRIKETGSGLWATPAASDGGRGGSITPAMTGQSLPQMVNTPEFWRTPTSRDHHPSKFDPDRKDCQVQLAHQVSGQMWPTPTVHGDYNRKGASKNSGDGLATAVKLYPTPTSTNTKAVHMRGADKGKKREARTYFPTPQSRDFRTGEGQRGETPERSRNLNDFAALFPTPCAQDAKNSTLPISQRDRDSIPGYLLSTGENPGGQLNPDWVEWLMGWPIGWTSLGQLNPEAFREWQKAFRIESDGLSVLEMDKCRRAR